MKIQYFSDLHLECFKKQIFPSIMNQWIQVRAPILALCGDIGNPSEPLYKSFLQHVSSRFEKIFIICGNHEYYHHTIPETEQQIRSLCTRFPNISFLQNSFEDYHGYRFAGTTLWSHISNPTYLTNDFTRIQGFSITTCNQLHQESKNFVQQIMDSSPIPVIMLSHHVPSTLVIDPIYDQFRKTYQQCYSSSSEDLIRPPIHTWIYGHTHRPYVGMINGVHMHCNPIGYPGENKDICFHRIIEW